MAGCLLHQRGKVNLVFYLLPIILTAGARVFAVSLRLESVVVAFATSVGEALALAVLRAVEPQADVRFARTNLHWKFANP
jgi:hypothetical protein